MISAPVCQTSSTPPSVRATSRRARARSVGAAPALWMLLVLVACGEGGTATSSEQGGGAPGVVSTGSSEDRVTAGDPALSDGIPASPVNVIFVSLDTLRADHLQPYGYERETSPLLAQLAEQGVVFEDCVATANWTLPTHTSLFTGLNPITHQVEEATDKLPVGCPTLVEPFAEAGYRTAGFWSNPFVGPSFGYARGFETYERAASDDQLRAMIEHAGEPKGSKSRHRFPGGGERETDYLAAQPAELVTSRAMEWLAALEPDEPFFLFLHYNDVHSDYIPPMPYDEMFDPDYAGDFSPENYPHHPGATADMNPRDLDRIRALYDGEIRWVDDTLGSLLRPLMESPAWDNTMVVITADHGEGFFERGFKEHHYGLYRELLHIPLIVRHPTQLPAGQRVSTTVSQADVAPTILELAGLQGLEGADGRSLVALAENPAARLERPPVLSHAVLKPILDQPGDEMVSMTTPEVHAVLRLNLDGSEALQVFDRRADPKELSPLEAGTRTEAVERALRAAATALRERRAMLPWTDSDSSQPLDPELYERMKGWGYIK